MYIAVGHAGLSQTRPLHSEFNYDETMVNHKTPTMPAAQLSCRIQL